jgi:beta-glucosidase-like glycosyl hydrolase
MSVYEQALAKVASGTSPEVAALDLVAHMTLDEKVHCLDGGVPFWIGVGDITTGGYHSRPFRGARVERLGIPGFHFSDGPRGVVVGEATAFPVSMARGATFDPELEVRVGDAIGKELRAVGADLYGGICVNLLRHPAWGRAQETYGEDPHHVGEMGASLTSGAQRHVMATLKHFALNSMENARFGVDVSIDERALHEVYLPHFKRIIDEGVACVMTAYNSVNGEWCGENTALISDILRNEWGFAGFVISDWIFGLRDGVKSLQAGLDVEMPYRMIRNAPITSALSEGLITEELVASAVTRTLTTMLKFGVGKLPVSDRSVVLCQEHLALSQEVAEKSMVLLKNEAVNGAALLPLNFESGSTIGVFGRLAGVRNIGDGGSSDVMAPNVVTPLLGIVEHFANCTVVHDADATIAAQVEQAKLSNVAIIVVGYTKEEEGEFIGDSEDTAPMLSLIPRQDDPDLAREYEKYMHENHHYAPDELRIKSRNGTFSIGGDRESLRLMDADVQLIHSIAQVQPRTVVVIVAGSAVVMSEWINEVPAVLMGWYSGSNGGRALANVLAGAVNPSGRLPFVIPNDESHLPFFDRNAKAITYDYWHGQWKLDRDGNKAMFPFGFGCSYTTFSYSDVTVEIGEVVKVRCAVRNTGAHNGATVVQAYAGRSESAIERPLRRLVAFKRVEVAAGETVQVECEIPFQRFATRDVHSHGWFVEGGTWNCEVGEFSGDPRSLSASFHVPEGIEL